MDISNSNFMFEPGKGGEKKTYKFVLSPNESGVYNLPACTKNVKAFIIASFELKSGFTLGDIGKKASAMGFEFKTKSDNLPDYEALGATNRPKLLELGILEEEGS